MYCVPAPRASIAVRVRSHACQRLPAKSKRGASLPFSFSPVDPLLSSYRSSLSLEGARLRWGLLHHLNELVVPMANLLPTLQLIFAAFRSVAACVPFP